MPELPEVETTRRGIEPYIKNKHITAIILRETRMRWPVPESLPELLKGQRLVHIDRRGKYLIFIFNQGALILHLGMSGSLRIVKPNTPPRKHDHVDLVFANEQVLRFHDPRRFGSLHWTEQHPQQHPLLAVIGIEPLSADLSGDFLHEKSRKRKVAVKNFIMNSRILAGVGNIYANEALFLARIHPNKPAGRISLNQYKQLAKAIKQILRAAIRQGGTTLRDFVREDGTRGYFRQKLRVYERPNLPCRRCTTLIKTLLIGQRSSYFCPLCQK